MECKQVIVVRADLKMGKGKMAAQAAHASLEAYKSADRHAVSEWESSGVKKVVLKVDSLQELMGIYNRLKKENLKPVLISFVTSGVCGNWS